MNDHAVTQRLAVVTGAASGIGAGISQTLARCGFRVAFLDRDPSVATMEIGGVGRGFVVDISSEQAVTDVAEAIGQIMGPADVLVNNAAVSRLAPAATFAMTDWDELMATNIRGAFLCARAFGPGMIDRKWGRIINIASQHAEAGLPNHIAYTTAKAGMLGMTRVLAAEWGPSGVTVNAVSPTLTQTPMADRDWPEEARAKLLEWVPTRRLATIEDVASTVAFLAAEKAGMINGHNLVIDGGSSITL